MKWTVNKLGSKVNHFCMTEHFPISTGQYVFITMIQISLYYHLKTKILLSAMIKEVQYFDLESTKVD